MKSLGSQWATTPWSAPPWLWPLLWRRAKNKGTPNISQNQDFSGAPPTRFVKKRVGVLWLCLIFLRDWEVGNSCHPPLDLCALRARVETASSSGLLKKQDTQSDVLFQSGAGYEARTRFPASHELRSAIRGNPNSPLIKMRFAHGCRYRVLFV